MTYEYTDYTATPASSAVDGVYFNENENFVVIDWGDSLYRFNDVSREEYMAVVEPVNGTWWNPRPSVGRAANALKHAKGPGEFLGSYSDVDFAVDFKQVDVRTSEPVFRLSSDGSATFSGSVYPKDPMTEFMKDIGIPHEPVTWTPKDLKTEEEREAETATPEFSLEPVSVAKREKFTVYFDAPGGEKTHVVKGVETHKEAVDVVLDFADSLDLDVAVTKVVVEFV